MSSNVEDGSQFENKKIKDQKNINQEMSKVVESQELSSIVLIFSMKHFPTTSIQE